MPFTDPADYFLSQRTTAEGTFMPPINCVDLLPELHREFQCRFGDLSLNAAEFYHENSKVIRSSTRRIAQNQESIASFIQHYIDTPYNYSPETVSDIGQSPILPAFQWRQQVPPAIHQLGIRDYLRYFALDAYVLSDNQLCKVLPNKQILVKDRIFGADKMKKLQAAFYGPDLEAGHTFRHLVFFVGCPWRYMMLYGPKGYRRMLMDLGHILAGLQPHIEKGALCPLEYFYDNEIDRFLDLDGIEQSVQFVLGVPSGTSSGASTGEPSAVPNPTNGANSHE